MQSLRCRRRRHHASLVIASAGAAALATASFFASTAHATPYASGVSETAGTISFTLNEDAQDVIVVRDGVETSLGALGAGTQTFTRDGATNYSIRVVGSTGNAGFLNVTGTIATATNGQPVGTAQAAKFQPVADSTSTLFNAPRGVAVNRNPANGALFGRVYVTNAGAGAATGFLITRNTTRGIYALNANLTDAVGQGDNANVGSSFIVSGSSPWRVALDAEGYLYVTDWSDANGSLYRIDPALTAGNNVFPGVGSSATLNPAVGTNHGSVSSIYVEGKASDGSLVAYTLDEDLTSVPIPPAPASPNTQLNSIWQYNLGSTTSGYSAVPTEFALSPLINSAKPQTDMDRGKDGKWYLMQNRSAGGALANSDAANNRESGIAVLSPTGSTVLFRSWEETRKLGLDASQPVTADGVQDVLRQLRAVAISPDQRFLASIVDEGGVLIVPLIGGIPDIANRHYVDVWDSDNIILGRGIDIDAAGNVYAASSGNAQMRVLSPGGVSQTVLASNNTFTTIYEPSFNGTGNLSDAAKWLSGQVSSGDDSIMAVGNVTGGANTITVDADRSLARLRLSGGDYTVSGASKLTMGAGVLQPRIIAEVGNHTVSAPIDVRKSLGVAADAGASLTLTNVAYTSDGTAAVNNLRIVKWGEGTVTMPTFTQATVEVKAGTLRFSGGPTGAPTIVNAIDMAGGFVAPRGAIDLGKTGLVLDYAAPTPPAVSADYANVLALVVAGRAGPTGLRTSAAGLVVGIAEGSDIANSFMGQTLDGTAVAVRATLAGDFDLTGNVNFDDLLKLAANYNQSTNMKWTTGDANYDGSVNFDDLLLLAANYNQAVTGSLGGDWALALSSVPEPTSLAVIGAGAAALLGRRRRR